MAENAAILRIQKCHNSGYVLKKSVIAELKVAVERVAKGEIYLSKDVSARLHRQSSLQYLARGQSPLEHLSSRQREILQLLAEGQTTKGIALILKVSPKTIEFHRGQLMQRLNVFGIPGLVRFAVRAGLVSLES